MIKDAMVRAGWKRTEKTYKTYPGRRYRWLPPKNEDLDQETHANLVIWEQDAANKDRKDNFEENPTLSDEQKTYLDEEIELT